MPGLIDLYVTTANIHINEQLRNGTPHRISRARIEFEIMEELDKAPFATDLKIAWYYAILTNTTFLSFWAGQRALHNLPATSLTAYAPDMTLLQYIAPPSPTSPSPQTTIAETSTPNDTYELEYGHANGDGHTPTHNISPNSTTALTQALAAQAAVYDREDGTYHARSGKRKRTTPSKARTGAKPKPPARRKAGANDAPKTKTAAKGKGKPRKSKAVAKVEEAGDGAFKGKKGKGDAGAE